MIQPDVIIEVVIAFSASEGKNIRGKEGKKESCLLLQMFNVKPVDWEPLQNCRVHVT